MAGVTSTKSGTLEGRRRTVLDTLLYREPVQ